MPPRRRPPAFVQKLDSDYKDVYILKPYYKAHVDLRRGDYKAVWDEK
jgi:hypothetical protein